MDKQLLRARARRCWTGDSFPPPSPGATGSARPPTGTAVPVPTALPATEEDARTTCATKVSGDVWSPPPPMAGVEEGAESDLGLLCWSAETAETQDMNEVEKPQAPPQPRTTAAPAPKPKVPAVKKPAPNTNASRTPSSKGPSSTYFGKKRKLHFD